MTYTLIYYPGCSNCRNGLALLQEAGVEPVLRKYMTDQLCVTELKDIAEKMGNASPRVFLRDKAAREAGLTDASSDDEIFAAMAANPKLIQRPIGLKGDKAVLGRPNEALLEII